MSDPLSVMAASDGSTVVSDMTVVTKEPSGGIYPMEYTLNFRGTYVMNVTGPDGQVDTERNFNPISPGTAMFCVACTFETPHAYCEFFIWVSYAY